MGVMLVASGAAAPWNSKVALPVMRGLEGYFTFDTEPSRFGFNRAPGKKNAQITGAPLAFSGFGRFNGQLNFLTTDIVETANQTIIVVGRAAAAVPANAPSASQPVYVSNNYGTGVNPPYVGITATGVALYHPDNARTQGSGARDNGSGAASSASVSVSSTPADSWAIRAVRVTDTGVNMVKDLTTGAVAFGTSSSARVLNNKTFRIGAGAIGSSGLVDIAAIMFLSVASTDAEMEILAGVMRMRMTRFGIGV